MVTLASFLGNALAWGSLFVGLLFGLNHYKKTKNFAEAVSRALLIAAACLISGFALIMFAVFK